MANSISYDHNCYVNPPPESLRERERERERGEKKREREEREAFLDVSGNQSIIHRNLLSYQKWCFFLCWMRRNTILLTFPCISLQHFKWIGIRSTMRCRVLQYFGFSLRIYQLCSVPWSRPPSSTYPLQQKGVGSCSLTDAWGALLSRIPTGLDNLCYFSAIIEAC